MSFSSCVKKIHVARRVILAASWRIDSSSHQRQARFIVYRRIVRLDEDFISRHRPINYLRYDRLLRDVADQQSSMAHVSHASGALTIIDDG